jgi:hypothetical protein
MLRFRLATIATILAPLAGLAAAPASASPGKANREVTPHDGFRSVEGQRHPGAHGEGRTWEGPDCNGNGVADAADIAAGTSADANTNGIPDECDFEVCEELWRGFQPVPPFYTGTAMQTIDRVPWYDGENDPEQGDGVHWDNPEMTASINSPGCGSSKGVKLAVDPDLSPVENGYVATEYLRTVDGALDCPGTIYALSFTPSVRGAIDSRYDWQFAVVDAGTDAAVARLEFASTRSNRVPTDMRGRVLVTSPTGGYVDTGVEVIANACYGIQIVLDNRAQAYADGSVIQVWIDGELKAVFDTPLQPGAHRMDYILAQPTLCRVTGSMDTSLWLDNFNLCVTGPALHDWDDCNGNCVADEVDILNSFSPDCNANAIPDECDVAAGTSPDCTENGVPDECEGLMGAERLYVDQNAGGANNGLTWEDAFLEIRAALCLASDDPGVAEIWVAAGTYAPAGSDGERTASFRLMDGLKMYGGFAGWEDSIDQRDVNSNATVLTGDLLGDDEPGFMNRGDNVIHVVTASDSGPDAVLDGFIIIGGNAVGDTNTPAAYGGGIYLSGGAPSFINCMIVDNRAKYGGGVCNAGGEPSFVACRFVANQGIGFG